jgi:hypothetical protein
MQCPRCNLLNQPNAERCDCGYDFIRKAVLKPYAAAPPDRPLTLEEVQKASEWIELSTFAALAAILVVATMVLIILRIVNG